ncbi:5'-AMP-activated protein kinase subunit beta-2 isoform X3 [Cebus imitator]|uniref:5'-AMP-activated protein kinase subunit beta-2 isoform X3 n=1 Tax=Sapajus apella TaxID=9515 RepID=A0A6J3H472_SAPAP|nr:5'-AMP-activated protein kinase subunit beta-2 isoform X3 [Cebus imitator]XP_032124765.1 5'-AMP-activated protein kinase subunit beta-2 isoform X3 [Sapajus apella]
MPRGRSTRSWWEARTTPACSACPTPSHNDFVAILDLPEGEHQYKFFVDGQWVHDPSEPVVTSQLGTINNLIHVKKSDFEVFDALKLDSMESSEASCRDLSSSPPGPYGQEMYVFRSEERFKSPPILPPHLLQVILNKDTNISCDPALLPEPNHVMLNHLYALSIKIKKLRLREGQIARQCDGPQRNPSLQEEVCYYSAIQAHLKGSLLAFKDSGEASPLPFWTEPVLPETGRLICFEADMCVSEPLSRMLCFCI